MPAVVRTLALLPALIGAWGEVEGAGFVFRPDGSPPLARIELNTLAVFTEGRENLAASLTIDGVRTQIAWLIPVPAPPEVSAENRGLPRFLARVVEGCGGRWPRDRGHEQKVTVPIPAVTLAGEECDERSARAGEGDRNRELVILDPAEGTSPEAWLQQCGMRPKPHESRAIRAYIERGWVFAAMSAVPRKADAGVKEGDGPWQIGPYLLRFPTAAPVCPLHAVGAGIETVNVDLYVVSSEPMRPRHSQTVQWATLVFPASVVAAVEDAVWGADPDSLLFPEELSGLILTRNHATLPRAYENDAGLVPWDPADALSSEDAGAATNAVAYLGWRKPAEAEGLILASIERRPEAAGLLTALWALGEIGGERATTALLRYGSDGDLEVRSEALDSLCWLKAKAALPLLVDGLCAQDREAERTEARSMIGNLRRICFGGIVSFGDASCIEPLRTAARMRDGNGSWEQKPPMPYYRRVSSRVSERDHSFRYWDDPAPLTVAALAGLRDADAVRRISEVIASDAVLATEPEITKEAANAEAILGKIRALMTGYPLTIDKCWPTMGCAMGLFYDWPVVHDMILRGAVARGHLDDVATAALLANLREPTAADSRILREIWDRAIRPPVRAIAFRAPGEMWWERRAISFNCRAVGAVWALARHLDTEGLLRIWSGVPHDDDALRAEIMYAMATTRDPAFKAVIVEHIRNAWSARARSPLLAALIDEVCPDENDAPREELDFFGFNWWPDLDFHKTARAIGEYVARPAIAADVHALLAEKDFPLYVRLCVIGLIVKDWPHDLSDVSRWEPEPPPFPTEIRSLLVDMEREAQGAGAAMRRIVSDLRRDAAKR